MQNEVGSDDEAAFCLGILGVLFFIEMGFQTAETRISSSLKWILFLVVHVEILGNAFKSASV